MRIARRHFAMLRSSARAVLSLVAGSAGGRELSILCWCRSGKHRSVAVAQVLVELLKAQGHHVRERRP